MKTLKPYITFFLCVFLLSSCFTDRDIKFTKNEIEFDNAVVLARATGEIFPIINLTRASGTPAQLVNLVGAQRTVAEQINFSTEEVPDRLLNATTIKAVQGVHYTLNGATFSFPEKASTTNFTGLTINSGFPAQPGISALVIIKLDESGNIKPSENFRRLAFKISLN